MTLVIATLARAVGFIAALRGRQKIALRSRRIRGIRPSSSKASARFWSVRVGLNYRALAVEASNRGRSEFWIGSHAEYVEKIKFEAP
jgi:hypothetical protein